MILSSGYSFVIILVIALVTFSIRAFPFVFFGRREGTSKFILYLGIALPPAIIAMLIIYSLRNSDLSAFPFALPELIAVFAVVMLHLWKRNNLISILGGTAVYMLAVQYIFVK